MYKWSSVEKCQLLKWIFVLINVCSYAKKRKKCYNTLTAHNYKSGRIIYLNPTLQNSQPLFFWGVPAKILQLKFSTRRWRAQLLVVQPSPGIVIQERPIRIMVPAERNPFHWTIKCFQFFYPKIKKILLSKILNPVFLPKKNLSLWSSDKKINVPLDSLMFKRIKIGRHSWVYITRER